MFGASGYIVNLLLLSCVWSTYFFAPDVDVSVSQNGDDCRTHRRTISIAAVVHCWFSEAAREKKKEVTTSHPNVQGLVTSALAQGYSGLLDDSGFQNFHLTHGRIILQLSCQTEICTIMPGTNEEEHSVTRVASAEGAEGKTAARGRIGKTEGSRQRSTEKRRGIPTSSCKAESQAQEVNYNKLYRYLKSYSQNIKRTLRPTYVAPISLAGSPFFRPRLTEAYTH